MAPGRAESDFGPQSWIDPLGLKQIFLISSASGGVIADIKFRLATEYFIFLLHFPSSDESSYIYEHCYSLGYLVT